MSSYSQVPPLEENKNLQQEGGWGKKRKDKIRKEIKGVFIWQRRITESDWGKEKGEKVLVGGREDFEVKMEGEREGKKREEF